MAVLEEQSKQSDRVITYYQRTAQDYDKEYDMPYWKELYDKLTWRMIEPYLPKAGVILDAGGGTGKWAIPMAEKGLRVVTYDVSQQMLDVAVGKIRERHLEKMIQTKVGDICSLGFPDSYFDFVLAEGDPISYCDDPDKAVEELSRVLKPGCFISAGVDSLFALVRVTLRSKQDLDGAMKILDEKRFYSEHAGFHFWAFTPGDLRALFEKHGLETLKIIGKPVLYSKEMESMLKDSVKAKKLLDIELMLCEQESMAGCGGHLHILARKTR